MHTLNFSKYSVGPISSTWVSSVVGCRASPRLVVIALISLGTYATPLPLWLWSQTCGAHSFSHWRRPVNPSPGQDYASLLGKLRQTCPACFLLRVWRGRPKRLLRVPSIGPDFHHSELGIFVVGLFISRDLNKELSNLHVDAAGVVLPLNRARCGCSNAIPHCTPPSSLNQHTFHPTRVGLDVLGCLGQAGIVANELDHDG